MTEEQRVRAHQTDHTLAVGFSKILYLTHTIQEFEEFGLERNENSILLMEKSNSGKWIKGAVSHQLFVITALQISCWFLQIIWYVEGSIFYGGSLWRPSKDSNWEALYPAT